MNLGYILNIKYTATSLGLSEIEKYITGLLHTRNNNMKTSGIKGQSTNKLEYYKAALESPEEEIVFDVIAKDKESGKDELSTIRQSVTLVRECNYDVKIRLEVIFIYLYIPIIITLI